MEKKNQIPKYPLLRFPEFTDEWKEVKLGEVLSFEVGYPFSSDAFNEEGNGVRLIKNRDLKADDRVVFYGGEYDAQYIVQNGDILIGMDGDFSPCLWKKGKALLNQRVGRVNANQNTSRVFILYVLVDSLKKIEHKTSSTTVKHLSHKDVEKIKAFLPSLAEQKKIAALLSLIDERIEVQNAIIKEQEAQKAALLRRLFDRTLRFPEFTDEWKEVKLGKVAEIIGGGTPSTTTTDYWNGGIVWFNPSEIGKKKYVSNSNRTISHQGLSNSGARLLPKGTVLLTTRATIGEIAIANVECTTNQGFQSVITGCEANNEYVYYFLSTQKEYLLRHSSGSTFRETPPSVIRNLPLRLPSLPEQRKIADLLSAVDERLSVEREYAEQLKQQKAYLLRQMFI